MKTIFENITAKNDRCLDKYCVELINKSRLEIGGLSGHGCYRLNIDYGTISNFMKEIFLQNFIKSNPCFVFLVLIF